MLHVGISYSFEKKRLFIVDYIKPSPVYQVKCKLVFIVYDKVNIVTTITSDVSGVTILSKLSHRQSLLYLSKSDVCVWVHFVRMCVSNFLFTLGLQPRMTSLRDWLLIANILIHPEI